MIKFSYKFTITILSTFLFGCSAKQYEQGQVQQRWSNSLRQLGIVPVFPPREDFFVGDIYNYSYNPEGTAIGKLFNADWDDLSDYQKQVRMSIGMNSRLARIDLNKEILNEYISSPAAPPTTEEYNRILSNPVIASADKKIEEIQEVLNNLKKEKSNLSKLAEDNEKELKLATRKQEDEEQNIVDMQKALDTAQKKPHDTSELQSKLDSKKLELRLKEDSKRLAQKEYDLIPQEEEEKKKAAKSKLDQAEYDRQGVEIEIRRIVEDISAVKNRPVDVSAEKEALAKANADKEKADKEVLRLTRIRDDISASNTKKIQEIDTKITTEKTNLTNAKELRTNIVKAGTQYLYTQPQYTNSNVFTGEKLPEIKKSGYHEKGYYKNQRVNRLRIVGFPEFSSVSISQGDLSALIPSEALKINISSSEVEKVTVKIPAAESYGLSINEVYNSLFVYNETNNNFVFKSEEIKKNILIPALLNTSRICEPELEIHKKPSVSRKRKGSANQRARKRNKFTIEECKAKSIDAKKQTKLYFRLITEVFYARAIDVSLFSNNSFGGILQYLDQKTSSDQVDAGNNSDDDTFQDPLEVKSPGQDSKTNSILNDITKNLTKPQPLPGGSVQILNATQSSIGLRRVYDRPIAIGFRGITFEYNICRRDSKNCTQGIKTVSLGGGETSTLTQITGSSSSAGTIPTYLKLPNK